MKCLCCTFHLPRRLRTWLSYTWVLLLVLACTRPEEAQTSEALKAWINHEAMIQSFHPTLNIAYRPQQLVFLPMTYWDRAYGQVPLLLRSLPEPHDEGTRWTFQLREDIRWPDGSPVGVEDVIFSLKIWVCRELTHPAFHPVMPLILGVQPMEALPGGFVLETQASSLVPYLSDYLVVLNESELDPKGILRQYELTDMKQLAVKEVDTAMQAWLTRFKEMGKGGQFMASGLGPYEVAHFEPGNEVVLQRVGGYWGESLDVHPRLAQRASTIQFQPGDIGTGLKNQAIDWAHGVEPVWANNYGSAYHRQAEPGQRFYQVVINTQGQNNPRDETWTLPLMRRALAHLTDKEALIRACYSGEKHAQAVLGPVAADIPEFHPDLDYPAFDPEKGRRLLEQVGWTDSDGDGLRDHMVAGQKQDLIFNLYTRNAGEIHSMITDGLRSQWEAAGIRCVVHSLEASLVEDVLKNGQFDGWMMRQVFQRPMVDFYAQWHTEMQMGRLQTNVSGFGSPDTDRLIDSLRTYLPEALRIRLSKEIQRRILEAQPVIPLFSPHDVHLIHPRFGEVEAWAFHWPNCLAG